MHKATFKITSHMRSIALLLGIYICVIVGGKDLLKTFTKESTPPSYTVLFTIAAIIIIALYINYIVGKIRLVFTSSGITLTQLPFNMGTWELAWKDVSESVLICAPMGGHKILLKNPTKERMIGFPLWALDENTLNIQKDSSPFFKYSRNKPPEDFALYQAIKYFQPNLREASSREATEVVQKQFDLGKEAGIVSGGAALFVLLGLFVGLMNKSRVLDTGYLDIFCGVIAVAIGSYALYYMRKCPQKIVNVFISLLIIGCSFWGIRSIINTATYYYGSETTFTFFLDKNDTTHQEWKTLENNKLTIEIYAHEDNRTYSNANTKETRQIIIRKGVFSNYCIPYDTLNTFVKDPTKRRSRH